MLSLKWGLPRRPLTLRSLSATHKSAGHAWRNRFHDQPVAGWWGFTVGPFFIGAMRVDFAKSSSVDEPADRAFHPTPESAP